MSTIKQGGNLPVSFFADEDLTGKQYYGVHLTASVAGHVQLATGSSAPVCFGVLQTDSASEDSVAEIKVFGFTKVRTGTGASAISAGERLSVGGLGDFHVYPTDAGTAGSGINVVAIALDAMASGCAGYIGAWFFGGIAPCGGGAGT